MHIGYSNITATTKNKQIQTKNSIGKINQKLNAPTKNKINQRTNLTRYQTTHFVPLFFLSSNHYHRDAKWQILHDEYSRAHKKNPLNLPFE